MDKQCDINPLQGVRTLHLPCLKVENGIIYDPETCFILDTRNCAYGKGKVTKELPKSATKYLLELLKRTERGEIVNRTAVVEDSEERGVDHFNLRQEYQSESPVDSLNGKSLEDSLELWKECKDLVKQIELGHIVNEKGERYTNIILNAIGGNVLCARMLIKALGKSSSMNIQILANTDPLEFKNIMCEFGTEKTLIFVFSKSGTTDEVIGNMKAFHSLCSSCGIEGWPRTVVATSPKTPLDKQAENNNSLRVFHVNTETGGRNSISSTIGMLICALYHISFPDLLKGMSYMDKMTRNEIPEQNPALILANIIHQHKLKYSSGELVFLSSRMGMYEMPHYLQQLYMESLGKEYDVNGILVEQGITVYGDIISDINDMMLHKIQKQDDRSLYAFVSFLTRDKDVEFSSQINKVQPYSRSSLGRKLLNIETLFHHKCIEEKKPFIDIKFRKMDEFSLGMLIALHERVVAFLGWLWKINPFDQPGVQAAKQYARGFNILAHKIINIIAKKEGKKIYGNALQIYREVKCENMFDGLESYPNWKKSPGSLSDVHLIDAILLDMCTNKQISWSNNIKEATVKYSDGIRIYNIETF